MFEQANQLRMISRRFIEEFTSSVDLVEFKKGQQWLSVGQHSSQLILIQDGAMAASRNYQHNSCISMVYNDSDAVFSPESFFLADSTVYSLDSRTLNALSAKYDDMQFIIAHYLAQANIRATRHSFMLACYSPAEKFSYAMEELGRAFRLLTREQQASFLGISRRTLSELF
jgi:CRP-like cAMP-binding protein